MNAKDVLARHGFAPKIKWCDGMVSIHEIMATLGVSEAQASRVLRRLKQEPDLEAIRVKHPKTGRELDAVITKIVPKKTRRTRKVQTRV